MENIIAKRGEENYTVYFEDGSELQAVKDLYEDREANSQRVNYDTALISEDDIRTQEEMKDIPLSMNAFPAMESKIWMKVKDMYYPLSAKGLSSEGSRIKLIGEGLFLLDNALLKKVIIDIFGKLTGKDRVIKVIVIDDMIRAVMSADYKIVPIKDVIDTLDAYLDNRFKGFSFKGGLSTYDKVSLMFEFPKTEEIPLMYGKKTTWTSGLKFESSDTGMSSNIVKACWYTERGRIVFDDVTGKVRLIHKGTNDLDVFEKSLETLFVKLHDRAKFIQQQVQQKVSDPQQMIELLVDAEESPVLNKAMFKQLFGKKDLKALQAIMDMKLETLKGEYKDYIALLDEDEEIPEFAVTMYDIIQVFMAYQDTIKPEKREKLEYFCGVLLITDFAEFIANN